MLPDPGLKRKHLIAAVLRKSRAASLVLAGLLVIISFCGALAYEGLSTRLYYSAQSSSFIK